MTFTTGSRLDPSRVQRRGASAGAGGMAIGGGIGGLLLLIASALLGFDITGLLGGGTSGSTVSADDPAAQAQLEEKCTTGADANNSTDCLVVGSVNSLDSYWSSAVPALGADFAYPEIVLFDSQTSTACGTASVQTGPFYCPTDQTIYIETHFTQLLAELGGSTGPLAQEYVIAHEYGHHIQQILGVFDIADRSGTGANSDSVKVELMADCLAGVWTRFAATAPDAAGTPFLVPPTAAEINDALSAAGAVGDDTIQEASGGQANPDAFTHGTSEQRIQAFTLGYQSGSVPQCDPFGVTGSGSGAH